MPAGTASTASVNSNQVYAKAMQVANAADGMNKDPNSANAGPTFGVGATASTVNAATAGGQIHPLRTISSVDGSSSGGGDSGSANDGGDVKTTH
jgi:hypothetical protein